MTAVWPRARVVDNKVCDPGMMIEVPLEPFPMYFVLSWYYLPKHVFSGSHGDLLMHLPISYQQQS